MRRPGDTIDDAVGYEGGIRDIKFLLNHPKQKNIQFLIFEENKEECANNITFFTEKWGEMWANMCSRENY